MDLSPVLEGLSKTLSAELPAGIPPLSMYTTNDDLELSRLDRDVYCFFSSVVAVSLLAKDSELPHGRRTREQLQQALAAHRFTLVSFAFVYYAERAGLSESVGYRIYARSAA